MSFNPGTTTVTTDFPPEPPQPGPSSFTETLPPTGGGCADTLFELQYGVLFAQLMAGQITYADFWNWFIAARDDPALQRKLQPGEQLPTPQTPTVGAGFIGTISIGPPLAPCPVTIPPPAIPPERFDNNPQPLSTLVEVENAISVPYAYSQEALQVALLRHYEDLVGLRDSVILTTPLYQIYPMGSLVNVELPDRVYWVGRVVGVEINMTGSVGTRTYRLQALIPRT